MNILVTGGGGFVGSALIAALRKKGHHVRAFLRRQETAFNLDGLEVEVFIGNLLDKEKVADAMKGIDVVFHSGAIYKGYPFYVRHPSEIYATNVEGTRNVLEAASNADVKKVIYTSSTAAVGKKSDGLPADESVKLNLLDKRSHYEKSKALAEEVALSYHQKGLHVVAVNPSFIFGVKDSRPTPTGEMITKFLNRTYPCYFDGIMCISDLDMVIEAHLKAMEMGVSGERYIVSYPRHYSIQEIFGLLEKISGIKSPRIRIPIPILRAFSLINELFIGIFLLSGKLHPIVDSEMVRYFSLNCKYDSSRAIREFGLSQKPLEEVLKSEIKWYMLNGYVRRSSKIRYFRKIGRLN